MNSRMHQELYFEQLPVVLGFIADHYGFRATFAVSALLVGFVIVVERKAEPKAPINIDNRNIHG